MSVPQKPIIHVTKDDLYPGSMWDRPKMYDFCLSEVDESALYKGSKILSYQVDDGYPVMYIWRDATGKTCYQIQKG